MNGTICFYSRWLIGCCFLPNLLAAYSFSASAAGAGSGLAGAFFFKRDGLAGLDLPKELLKILPFFVFTSPLPIIFIFV
jgi:hypothetical protein